VLALAWLLLAGAVAPVTREAATAAVLDGLVRDDQPGLAVLVRANGRTAFERSYGVRDLRARPRIDARAGFRLASVTKQLTAAVVVLLVRDGRLRYEDTLPEALPGFPDHARAVTIRHLLTHTSGLPDYETLMDESEKAGAARWTPERQIRDDEV
jgi:CubicO group peptidase (beta-lactamase class C family)